VNPRVRYPRDQEAFAQAILAGIDDETLAAMKRNDMTAQDLLDMYFHAPEFVIDQWEMEVELGYDPQEP